MARVVINLPTRRDEPDKLATEVGCRMSITKEFSRHTFSPWWPRVRMGRMPAELAAGRWRWTTGDDGTHLRHEMNIEVPTAVYQAC